MEVTVDKVKYLTPSLEDHGHWIVKEGESPRLAKYSVKKSIEPVTEATWLALERELADSHSIRRRLRNKTTIGSLSGVAHGEDKEQRKAAKIRGVRMLEEDAEKMILDHPEAVAEEVKILQKMRKTVAEEGSSSNKTCDAEVLKGRMARGKRS